MRPLPLPLFVALAACSDPDAPTWNEDVAPIVEAKCAGCHTEGAIGPFALTSYDEVYPLREVVAAAVESGQMPPWQAADGCNDYANDTSLSDEEKAILLAWATGEAREGRVVDSEAKPAPELPAFEPDLVLTLPEPYTPVALDDYRCQIVELGLTEPSFVTGFVAMPDREAVVHHVIAYQVPDDKRADFEAMDAADAAPGWACYGGPTAPGYEFLDVDLGELPISELIELFTSGEGVEALGGFGWLGSWAPGGQGGYFAQGTGIRVEPGDFLVVQMHYNTVSGSGPDQTAVAVSLASSVEKQAVVVPYADPAWVIDLPLLGEPMSIPAGDPDVSHDTEMSASGPLFDYVRSRLGAPEDGPLVVHGVAHHMHTLGTSGRQEVVHADGSSTCLVDIPDWDFHWQSRYQLMEPARLDPGDEVRLACTWDNSAANQAVIDGERVEPRDVIWGEGTFDEMCLGVLYVTEP